MIEGLFESQLKGENQGCDCEMLEGENQDRGRGQDKGSIGQRLYGEKDDDCDDSIYDEIDGEKREGKETENDGLWITYIGEQSIWGCFRGQNPGKNQH